MSQDLTFVLGKKTATADTAFAVLIPPFRGASGPPLLHKKRPDGTPNFFHGFHTVIDQLDYTCLGTVHDVVVMRPLNFTYVSADVAANGTVVNVDANPGTYTTAFKYPLPPDAAGLVASTANNLVAANDYVAVQLRDGTWHLTTVASISSLAITLTDAVPNVTGGGIEAGTAFYTFGVAADVVPQTGLAHVSFPGTASAKTSLLSSKAGTTFMSINPGDPLVVYSANATAAGTLALVSGHYAKIN